MATKVHPTAIIEAGATLGEGVEIGAYAFIGAQVQLGDGCCVHHHASIEGWTQFGADNEIFPYAYLGGRTQDKKWTGEISLTTIGDRNTFREFTTLHPSTFAARHTRVGSDNLFCAYAHIGHECHVGSHVVFSNNATLGGHVEVGDRVVIGGLTAVHQFCKIGCGAMIGGCCKVVQDVLPYMLAEGYPATHRAVNKIGMQRAGLTEEDVKTASRIHKLLFRSNLNRSQAMEALAESGLDRVGVGLEIVEFVLRSERGLA